jgi:methionine-rich copper-binding protein CopC
VLCQNLNIKRILWAQIFVLVLIMYPISSSFGHAELVSATPGAGSELTELPESVTLVFNEEVLNASESLAVVVLSPNQQELTFGEPRVDSTEVTRSLVSSNIPGNYQVNYRVVSKDGHVVTGEFMFTLLAVAVPSNSNSADNTESPPVNQLEPESTSWNLWMLFGLVAGLALVGLAIFRYKKQPIN